MPELVDAARRLARDTPDASLIAAPGEHRVVTARMLADDAGATARELRRLGIRAGYAVAAHVGNRSGYFSLLLACLDVGAALLPIDGSAPDAEAEAIASRFEACALVVPEGRVSERDGAGHGRQHGDAHALPGALRLLRRTDPAQPLPPTPAGPVAMLKLTSGSTGVPKSTLTTESQIAADGRALSTVMDLRPGEWQVGAIPVSHSYALGNVVAPLLLRGTAVVLRDAFVPGQILEDAVRAGARLFPGVPFMFDRLIALLGEGCAWPASLQTMISAGAPLESATARAFAALTGRRIHSLYGTSETAGIAYDADPDPDGDVTMGRPVPGVTLAFRPHDAAPAGGGRIHVRGPAVSSGYSAGADDDGFVDGGFLTGDLGALGADGRLRLQGRVSAFVNVAGRKVQPDEVEAVLRAHPQVADARVFGLPDERRGEQLAACVVPRQGDRPVGVVALRAFCADRLAPYKIPRRLVLVPELPRDERGKVSRRALEALVAGGPGPAGGMV